MTVPFTITPGIDQRLQAWNTHQNTLPKTQVRPCVTISRQYGCEGYPVAEALENRLNKRNPETKWVTLDRALLEKIAEESGYSKHDIERVQESPPIFEAMFSMFMAQHRAEPYEVFSYLKRAILHFASHGNCIIVGRASSILAQELKNCIHVRLVASEAFRTERTMKLLGVDEDKARNMVLDQQSKRNEFVKKFTHIDPTLPELYHLTLNNAWHTVDELCDLIEMELQQKFSI